MLRMITDVNATALPILPRRDETEAHRPVTFGPARRVADPHRYLGNMGVRASLSRSRSSSTASCRGLFAYRHYSTRCPTFERRSVSELFAQMFVDASWKARQQTVGTGVAPATFPTSFWDAVASDETLLNGDWLGDILTRAIPAGRHRRLAGRAPTPFRGTTPSTRRLPPHRAAPSSSTAAGIFAIDHIGSAAAGRQLRLGGRQPSWPSRSLGPRDYRLFRKS
jgi:hypothetical protein